MELFGVTIERNSRKKSRDREIIIPRVKPPMTSDVKSPKNSNKLEWIEIDYDSAIQPRNYSLDENPIDLTEIARALDVESYFRRAKDKYSQLMWKNPYHITGKNPNSVAYIKRRLQEISLVTRKPTYDLLKDISEELIPFYNCFIIKVRDADSSSGSSRADLGGKELDPVAGYFVVSAVRMSAVRHKDTHEMIGWNQEWTNPTTGDLEDRYWDKSDVIHITMSRKAGNTFGTPSAVPVLDDIRALRRMEENVEILVFQHAIPLYHYRVGSDDKPGTDDEVLAQKNKIRRMPTHAALVTTERHTIVAVGAAGEALDVTGYLDYFKNRIIAGLGHSTVGLGGGGGTANRGTATTMEKSTEKSAESFLSAIKIAVNEFMFKELLQEGGIDIFDEDNLVELTTEEIDVDTKIKREEHANQVWMANGLTESEYRAELGKDPFTDEERKETYFELVKKPIALIQAIDEPYSESAIKAKGNNKLKPENQYGKATGPGTPANDKEEEVEFILKDSIEEPYLDLADVYSRELVTYYQSAKLDIIEYLKDDNKLAIKAPLNLSYDEMARVSGKLVIDAYKSGVLSVRGDINLGYDGTIADLSILHGENGQFLRKLIDSVTNSINKRKKDVDVNIIHTVFEANQYRISFAGDYMMKKSFILGKAQAMRASGVKVVKIARINEDKNDECYKYPDEVPLVPYLNHEDLPPHHSSCECKIKP